MHSIRSCSAESLHESYTCIILSKIASSFDIILVYMLHLSHPTLRFLNALSTKIVCTFFFFDIQ